MFRCQGRLLQPLLNKHPALFNSVISFGNMNSISPSIPSARVSNRSTVKPPEPTPIESNNWLIYTRYTRKEFEICKLIIEEELMKSKGCNEYAIFILGLILRHEGKVHESLECFQKCLFLNPTNVKNIKEIGKSWVLLGHQREAIESLEEAEGLSKTPDWSIYHHLGECYGKLDMCGKGREYLRKAVQLGRTEQSYLALANLHLSENDINSALQVYDIALQIFPTSSELAIAQGLLYLKVGDYEQAFNKLGLALSISPNESGPLLAIGAIHQDNLEFDVALSKFKIVGQNLPESVTMWNNMGLCFFGKGKYVAGISCMKRAHYLDPLDWRTLYNLGLLHLQAKQYTSAFHFLSAAIRMEHKHPPSLMLLAISLQKLGDNENALKCFVEGTKLDPDDINMRVNYISCLCMDGNNEMALEQLNVLQRLIQQAEQVNQEVPEAVKQLTSVLLKDVLMDKRSNTHQDPNE